MTTDYQKNTEKGLKWTKKVETAKKVFQPAFGCVQHPKAGQNTKHTSETYSDYYHSFANTSKPRQIDAIVLWLVNNN